jgi:hypothetical protein
MTDRSRLALCVALSTPMRQVWTAVAAFVAGACFTTTIATDFRPEAKALASELAHGVLSGIILGSGVEPHQSNLAPHLANWRVAANERATDCYLVAHH